MSEPTHKPATKADKDAKQARLERALRQNLQRRKAAPRPKKPGQHG